MRLTEKTPLSLAWNIMVLQTLLTSHTYRKRAKKNYASLTLFYRKFKNASFIKLEANGLLFYNLLNF
jgi:hypothetical protein